MLKICYRLWFTAGLLLLEMCACAVLISYNAAKIRFVALTPGNPTIAIGDVQQFILNVTYEDGVVTQPSPALAIWATSNPSVAAINSQGQATGLKPGTAVITVTYKGVSGSTVLTVAAPKSVNIRVSGSATSLKVSFLKSGRSYLYISNPADDMISVYVNDPQDENRLESVVSVVPGRGPGWLAVSPSGRFLYVANHGSENISVFSIDPASGRLGDVPGSPFDIAGGVWAVAVEPNGRFLSATDLKNSSRTGLRIDIDLGALEP